MAPWMVLPGRISASALVTLPLLLLLPTKEAPLRLAASHIYIRTPPNVPLTRTLTCQLRGPNVVLVTFLTDRTVVQRSNIGSGTRRSRGGGPRTVRGGLGGSGRAVRSGPEQCAVCPVCLAGAASEADFTTCTPAALTNVWMQQRKHVSCTPETGTTRSSQGNKQMREAEGGGEAWLSTGDKWSGTSSKREEKILGARRRKLKADWANGFLAPIGAL